MTRFATMKVTLILLGLLCFSACGVSTRPGVSGGSFMAPIGTDQPSELPPVKIPPTHSIVLFATNGYYNGNFQADIPLRSGASTIAVPSFSARNVSDAICNQEKTAGMENLTIRAFIGINSTDQLFDMPARFGFSADESIVGDTGLRIATDWEDLFDGSIEHSLGDALSNVTKGDYYWTGSNGDGTLSSDTCGGWATTISPYTGTSGLPDYSDAGWLALVANSCMNYQKILCIAY